MHKKVNGIGIIFGILFQGQSQVNDNESGWKDRDVNDAKGTKRYSTYISMAFSVVLETNLKDFLIA